MLKLIRRLIVAFARVGIFFVALTFAYLAWTWWEQRELQAFCEAVRPGAPVTSLSALAEQHGFSRSWIERGLNSKAGEVPTIYVPATTRLGELVCAIRHDGAVVTSTEVDGR